MPTAPKGSDYSVSATGLATAATVAVPYPSGIVAGNLLLLSIVRGHFSSVADVSPAVAGWTLLTHRWGSNNYAHDTYYRVATGTETGSVSVTYPDVERLSTGVMIRLGRNVGGGSGPGGQFTGTVDAGAATGASISSPSKTPTTPTSLLLWFAGVPNGAADTNYSGGGMVLLGGSGGSAYSRSNQIYADVITGTDATGTRTWGGTVTGAIAPWRGYGGGLIPWTAAPGAPTVGYIGPGLMA